MSARSSNAGSATCLGVDTLAAFADGHISPLERARVATHVAACVECAELLASVRRAPNGASISPALSAGSAKVDGASSASGDPLFPRVIDRYAIHGKIAAGGIASVHFGRLSGGAGFSRTVAIKRLHPHLAEHPEFRLAMIDEARLVARVHHPNVVPTLDVVAAEGELLLVMEYVRGESLGRLARYHVERNLRIPIPITIAIAVGALHGLHAAHEATNERGECLGIVHRDVSPQNILVGIDGLARVIDFGVAKAAGRLQTTDAGTLKGKLAYMAPEQLSSREVTRAADVYALGIVLWEMLSGKYLFRADRSSDVALVTRVLEGAKVPPSHHAADLPPELDALVMKALARDPAQRFATALEMAESLMRVASPAFATEVGAWCARTARTELAKRDASLAEIESGHGAAYVERKGDARVGMVASAPPPRDEVPAPPRSSMNGRVHAEVARSPSDVPSTVSTSPGPRSQGANVAIAFGAGALVALLATAILWRHGAAPTAPVPSAQHSAATAGEAPSASSIPRLVPEPIVAPAASSPAAPPSAPFQSPSTSSSPASSSSAPHMTRPLSRPPSSADAPRSKVNCSPPYELDSQGKKTWKRQCL